MWCAMHDHHKQATGLEQEKKMKAKKIPVKKKVAKKTAAKKDVQTAVDALTQNRPGTKLIV